MRKFLLIASAILLVAMGIGAFAFYLANVPATRSLTEKRAPYRTQAPPRPAPGPLRVLKKNPRYVTADGRTAILLTGSHTWANLVDSGYSDPPPKFDYDAYLDFLEEQGHNFFRLWAWESACWAPWVAARYHFDPMPFVRTGPGVAMDGKPRFDLSKLNDAYFERLNERVRAASDRGIYVAVMLFNGWSNVRRRWLPGNGYTGHPFQYRNNINGLEPDRNYDGQGGELHRLGDPRLTAFQEAYVARVIDTVNEFENVVYEISNESSVDSLDWHNHMIKFIRRHEAKKPNQHLVGMSSFMGLGKPLNRILRASIADWVAPNNGVQNEYVEDPPPATGRKVSVLDTDHLWGIGGNPSWVWKAFLRGHHVIFMDGWDGQAVGLGAPYSWDIRHASRSEIIKHALGQSSSGEAWDPNAPEWVATRAALGDVQGLARRVPLADMVPSGRLASTGYCLAGAGHHLAFAPTGTRSIEIDLSSLEGELTAETFDVSQGRIVGTKSVRGGAKRSFETLPDTPTVVYVHAAGSG